MRTGQAEVPHDVAVKAAGLEQQLAATLSETSEELAHAGGLLLHCVMYQVTVQDQAPKAALANIEKVIAAAWDRLPKEVRRHFEVEVQDRSGVAEVKKPGLILPGGA